MYYCDKRANYPSMYQGKFKGQQVYRDHARIVDDYRTTLAGTTVPDPAVLRATGQRYGGFTHDLRTLTSQKFFKDNGDKQLNSSLGSPMKGDTFYHVENGFNLKERTYFGGEENDGQREGPIM